MASPPRVKVVAILLIIKLNMLTTIIKYLYNYIILFCASTKNL